jgi:hypothetical protein
VRLSVLFAGLMFSGAALAGQSNVLPVCHDDKRLPPNAGPLDTEIFVAIDQTTPLDNKLKQLVADNIKPFIRPNNGFSVMTFSAYTQGHYMEVKVSGKLDSVLGTEQRNDISKPVLAKFDQCITQQPRQASQAIGGALRAAFEGTSSDIAKSDVLASIKAISSKVRESTARNKVVLIVSDMLENSSISSFYSDKGKAVREIYPMKEMKVVEENQMLADFNEARIYVIGAGLLSDDADKARHYRDPKTMRALADFWRSYFKKSGSQLIEFGQPALLNPVR